MAVNCQGTNVNVLLLATIYRQREILYKSVSGIPVCPRLAAKVWLVWSWPYQFLCILLDCAVKLSRGFNIHARSNLVEPHSLVSTGEHGLL